MKNPRHLTVLLIAVIIALFAGRNWLSGDLPQLDPTATAPSSIQSKDLASLRQFPSEEAGAIEATVALIEAGGPFPYGKDGSIFSNREGRLPKQPAGYYREYTVDTPGSSDRGARRIVTGQGGEIYYTNDHYDSFVLIE
ncbi:MAG: ribonuclease domain-containing protein [Dongiaceae bacterium]